MDGSHIKSPSSLSRVTAKKKPTTILVISTHIFKMQNVYFQNGRQAVKQPVYIYYNCSYNKQIKDPQG